MTGGNWGVLFMQLNAANRLSRSAHGCIIDSPSHSLSQTHRATDACIKSVWLWIDCSNAINGVMQNDPRTGPARLERKASWEDVAEDMVCGHCACVEDGDLKRDVDRGALREECGKERE